MYEAKSVEGARLEARLDIDRVLMDNGRALRSKDILETHH